MAVDRRSEILSFFQPDIAQNLIRYAEHIQTLDADYAIFMARKSLRLYDLLGALGMPRREGLVISDLALDMSPEPLVGKKIALIDDTLIVGTSLAKTVQRINSTLSSEVTTHVFAQNVDWIEKSLIVPDTCLLDLSDAQMMTFCATEVRAMAALGIPYLLDFPFSAPVRVTASSFHRLFATFEWDGHCLSTESQARHGSQTYTFLPSQELLNDWRQRLGADVFDVLQIAKVRLFTRQISQPAASAPTVSATIVPIVTLKALKLSDLDLLFQRVVALCGVPGGQAAALVAPKAKLRYVQYALSTAVGHRFGHSLDGLVAHIKPGAFQEREAVRHFGPWMLDEIRSIHSNAHTRLFEERGLAKQRLPIKEAPLPHVIAEAMNDILVKDDAHAAEQGKQRVAQSSARNIVTDFNEIFLDLFDKHELPARKLAKKLGRKVLDNPYDRLNIGVPWGQIVSYLARLNDIRKPKSGVANVVSLLLDFWNDLGVAVPLLFVSEDTITRVYRHGEDVKITNQELSLVHTLAIAMTRETGADKIQRILFEKAIVCMFRVGVARDWLQPLYGTTGGENIARVGYHLKGAVVFFPRRTVSLLAGEQGSWLTSYCVERGILKTIDTGQYAPGVPVEANFDKAWAPHEVDKLGTMLGILSSNDGPLSGFRSQAIFATCVGPRETAAALEAELDIIHHWGRGALTDIRRRVDFTRPETLHNARKAILSSPAHEAVHSARMKWLALKRGEARALNQQCYDHIHQTSRHLASDWKAIWDPIFESAQSIQFPEIDRAIDRAAKFVVQAGCCLLVAEMALTIGAKQVEKKTPTLPAQFKEKVGKFLDQIRENAAFDKHTLKLIERLESRVRQSDQSSLNCAESWKYAMDELTGSLASIAAEEEQLHTLTSEAFSSQPQQKFSYLVWYDIIGSTGERFGLTGQDLKDHHERVVRFRNAVTANLRGVIPFANENRTVLHVQNGTVESENDEKHIYVGGPAKQSKIVAERIVQHILDEASRWPDVNVRIAMTSCNAFMSQVTRTGGDSEVRGERFLTHWKRLSDELKRRETTDFSVTESILYVCGAPLIEISHSLTDRLDLHTSKDATCRTGSPGEEITTLVRGWNVALA